MEVIIRMFELTNTYSLCITISFELNDVSGHTSNLSDVRIVEIIMLLLVTYYPNIIYYIWDIDVCRKYRGIISVIFTSCCNWLESIFDDGLLENSSQWFSQRPFCLRRTLINYDSKYNYIYIFPSII